jgi:hypothetical protein
LKEEAVMKEKLIPQSFAKKVAENKLCFKLYYYVQRLVKFASEGLQEESDDFWSNLLDTQMVSYYRQNQT